MTGQGTSSVLGMIQRMPELSDLRRAENAYQQALERAAAKRAERDEAIRAVLNAPGERPSQRTLASHLGLSAARVAQIAKGTR
jgi:hypothetical protein